MQPPSLYILGVGGGGAAGFAEVDAADGTVVLNHAFMDFSGYDVVLTDLVEETLVAVEGAPLAPAVGIAHPAVPNPFDSRLEIRFEFDLPTAAMISIYNRQGELARILGDGTSTSGWRSVAWNELGEDGRTAPSATYLNRIEAAGRIATGKVQFAK
jgi:hypothetical protein